MSVLFVAIELPLLRKRQQITGKIKAMHRRTVALTGFASHA
jgi:hypothetical protein